MGTNLNTALKGVDRLQTENPEMYETLKKINKYLPWGAKAQVAREYIAYIKETEGRDISGPYAMNRVSCTMDPGKGTFIPFIFNRLMDEATKRKKIVDKARKALL